MRLILALLLSVILALSGQSQAVARSEMAGAVDQVLCGAEGETSVTLDAGGRAVQRHPCTHCLAAGLSADLSAPVALPLAPVTRSASLTRTRPAQRWLAQTLTPSARAPPVPLA